jgi:UDP-N-acetyl-D-glucosamine dehydrogenase
VINESTSYPGTLREIVITQISKSNKANFLYAAAPERIDPANTKWSIKNTPRVIAGVDGASTNAALKFYRSICDQVEVVSSPEVAEAAKLFENTFRQVNIALVNELAQISQKLNISANEVIAAASTKPFGFMPFNPGLGVGGHCIPIDPIYLAQKAKSVGATAAFIDEANKVNEQMPLFILKRIKSLLDDDLKDKKICIIGLSYKSDVSDLRQSPSLLLWQELEKQGAKVAFHDEIVKVYGGTESSSLTVNAYDLSVVAVRHSNLNIDRLKKSSPIIFDCTGSIEGCYRL